MSEHNHGIHVAQAWNMYSARQNLLILMVRAEVKPHVLLRGLGLIRVFTLLEFTKPTLIAVTNVAAPPVVTYDCRAREYPSLHDGNQCLDGSGSIARKVFPHFRLILPKTQVTARSEPQLYFDCRSRLHLFPYLYRLAADLSPISTERLAGSGHRRAPNLECLRGE